ncbi:MAG: hypothetical protein V4714_13900 [Bacteroidota bacterium]
MKRIFLSLLGQYDGYFPRIFLPAITFLSYSTTGFLLINPSLKNHRD